MVWEPTDTGNVTKMAKFRQYIMSSANMREQGLTYRIGRLSGSDVELSVNKL